MCLTNRQIQAEMAFILCSQDENKAKQNLQYTNLRIDAMKIYKEMRKFTCREQLQVRKKFTAYQDQQRIKSNLKMMVRRLQDK